MMKASDFPPRGSGINGRSEGAPSATWVHPEQLGPNWQWQPGHVLLGRHGTRHIGLRDDRHMVTIAGARAGKTSTVLIPNLLNYTGSSVVFDPKAELARATVDKRLEMGHEVYLVDPFHELAEHSACHNPFSELGQGRADHVAADAAQIADALIISHEKDPHWTDSAKNLIRGITLYLLSTKDVATLRDVRRLLNATPSELDGLFEAMTDSSAFDGVVANIGASFLGKKSAGGRELQSILSTAQEQTAPLDDILGVTEKSDFRFADLSQRKMTIYFVLPGMRLGTHFRWLRLALQQALNAIERAPVPRGELPVWFMLEEFAALGNMRSIETAAGLMAGFGVKLWPVLQDLSQLKRHYPRSWETFLGNAGILQAFGNADLTTTEYLSKRLGNTVVMERQDVRVTGQSMAHGDDGRREHIRTAPLLAPDEITQFFSRESGRQMLLMQGRPPIYLERLGHAQKG